MAATSNPGGNGTGAEPPFPFSALEAELRATIDAALRVRADGSGHAGPDAAGENGGEPAPGQNWPESPQSKAKLRNPRRRGSWRGAAVAALLAMAAVAGIFYSRSRQDAPAEVAQASPDQTFVSGALAANGAANFESLPVPLVPEAPPAVRSETAGSAPDETPAPAIAVAQKQAVPAPAAGPTVPGVSDREIKFGIAAPFSGPSRELGRQMKLGIDSAFAQINEAGGVNGRMLKLVAADDGYEPARTADAMQQLIGKDQVFGFIGNVGTPTAAVALPMALERKMLFFGAFTGASLLRNDPPDRYAFNYRASYGEETAAVVRYLTKVKRLQPSEIVVFAQKDGFGDAGYAGVAKALRGVPGSSADPVRLSYARNTVDVQAAIAQMQALRTRPKAVVMVATYRAAAKFIEKTRDDYANLIYTNVSFVGSTALADELALLGPKYATGVIVTQVVPAVSSSSSFVLKYKAALSKYFPGEAPDYVSLEGYAEASLLIEALTRAGPQLDSDKLVDTLENIRNFDMGLGTQLTFGIGEHQASHKVWGSQLDAKGKYQVLELE